MSVRDVAAVLQSIGRFADALQSFGNNYFKASAALKRFPSQVLTLKAKLEHLHKQLERIQQSRLDSDLEALKEVEKLVTEQVNILEQEKEANHGRNRGIIPCCKRFGEMVFPKQIGLEIENATKALDDVMSHFATVRLDEETSKGAAVTKCHSFSSANYSTDSYVPLECTERKIYSALEKSDGASPTVVLIHGAPGRGKSTLARHVGLSLGRSKENFAHVLFLECDRQKEIGAAETGLLQSLREEDSSQNMRLLERVSQADVAERQQNIFATSAVLVGKPGRDEMYQESGSRDKLLKSFLRKEKLLIILDDVLDDDFAHHFLKLSGGGVKFIITARQDICKDLCYKYTPIEIEDLGKDIETSKKILAVHAGLPDHSIPDDCKGVAEEILSKADGLPLVIAQIGAQLGPSNHNLKVWKSVAADFFECLNEKPSRHVLNAGYNQTIWAALKQTYETCSANAQELLLLLGMCAGSSVSEAVLQFLYDIAFSGGERIKVHLFEKMKAELKGSQLVSENQEKCLSLHSSTKHFILDKMKKEVNEIAGRFFHQKPFNRSAVQEMNHADKSVVGCFHWQDPRINKQNPENTRGDDRFVIFLSCLYLDPRLDILKQIFFESKYHYSDDLFSPLKRSVVEPLTHLLVNQRPCCSDPTPTESPTSAMQIFLRFIDYDTLDYDHLLQLLDGSGAVMEVLQFLENVPLLEGPFWNTNNIRAVVPRIFEIFKDSTHPDVKVQAQKTLAALGSRNKKTNADIVDTPSLLDYLVQTISRFQNLDLRVNAASLLRAITYGADTTINNRIADRPKLLESLVLLLSEDRFPVLQLHAAVSLNNLALGAQLNQERIFGLHGLPEQLVLVVA